MKRPARSFLPVVTVAMLVLIAATARAEVPATGRCALKIGKEHSVEIAFDNAIIEINGAPMPLTVPPGKTILCRILADTDRVTVTLAQPPTGGKGRLTRFRLPIETPVDSPATVAFTSKGEPARVALDVWELRALTDPNARTLCHYPPAGWYWGSRADAMSGEPKKQ